MAKLSNKGLLIIALILSLVTTMLIYQYLRQATSSKTGADIPVVVAKVDIPPKTRITANMVQVAMVPAEYAQPGYLQDTNSVVGTITKEKIVAGEQLTERRLLLAGKTAGFTGAIPADMRAVTIAVTEVTGVAGFVRAGDYVDIIVTFDKGTIGDNVGYVMLQNVLVLAANRETEAGVNDTVKDKKEALKTSTVTVAVTPEQAAELAIAEDKGKVRLALRPYIPTNSVVVTNVVTPNDIVGVHVSPVSRKDNSTGNAAPRAEAPQPQPPPEVSPPRPAEDSGIQMIRGTKVERVPVFS